MSMTPAMIPARRFEVLMLVTMFSVVLGEALLGHIHLLGATGRPRGDSFFAKRWIGLKRSGCGKQCVLRGGALSRVDVIGAVRARDIAAVQHIALELDPRCVRRRFG